MHKKIGLGIIIFAIVAVPFYSVSALKNPSAIYCKEMGYELITEETKTGQRVVCKLSETESCPAWDFLAGKCGTNFSYCAKEGYEIKIVDECAVCVLENGKEVEVTKLMGLNFEAGVCNDGRCVLEESHETCPEDCPSGFFDSYCDGIKDDLCDPDCTSETDSDCIGRLVYIDVAVCADKNCGQKNKLFTQGETVYLKINNRTNLDITATVKNSDGEIEHLNFENSLATFQPDKIGTFSLWVDFSEEGKLKSRAKKLFFYTEKPAETPPVSICNANGKCEGEENEQNCPQDCSPKAESKLFTYIAFLVIALIIIGMVIFIVYKKRNNNVHHDKIK